MDPVHTSRVERSVNKPVPHSDVRLRVACGVGWAEACGLTFPRDAESVDKGHGTSEAGDFCHINEPAQVLARPEGERRERQLRNTCMAGFGRKVRRGER